MAPSLERPRRSYATGALITVGCLALFTAIRSGPDEKSEVGNADLTPQEGAAPVLSPLGFAADVITIDIKKVRWIWWPIILYLFWGMAYVCDEYFVRTIDVISDRFSIPDDVAGATLMALGCNGPEMALNTIAIFSPSNIGIGAVVGGEVFNVLVIIGSAVLATPSMYLPVKLGNFNFFRDVVFYLVSVAMLYWVLKNGSVSPFHASMLLVGAVCYTLTVVFSSKISTFLTARKGLMRTSSRRFTTRFSIRGLSPKAASSDSVDDDGASDISSEPDAETIEAWAQAKQCREPTQGSVLGVRVDVRNRMMDRGHRVDMRYLWLREDALVVSTLVDPGGETTMFQRGISGIVFDHDAHTHDHHWHHGGLVNGPIFFDDHPQHALSGNVETVQSLTRPLLNEASHSKHGGETTVQSPPSINLPGFRDAPWEVIPLQDILYCERAGEDQKHFNLHVHQHDSNLGNLITLELSTKEEGVMDAWVNQLRQKLLDQRRTTTEAPPAKGVFSLFMEWGEWLQFPVKFFVARSIPDMDDPKQQHLYPLSFFMSMVWLAIFAFSVVKACDGIHNDFGISTDILGFTVAAAGTSFPNVFSGMCVAKQGKTSMAVANALGANVQNVFLALAVPWTIQSVFITHGPFPLVVDNLLPALLECVITLIPVVLIYICCGFSMPWWSGLIFLSTYLLYVVIAVGQQVSHCGTWPFWCH